MIRAIAAVDRELGIARNGKIPWKLPTDEKYFTDETKKYGGVTLTGRVTYSTFHGPLKDRLNYILTHDPTPISGVTIVNDLGKFMRELSSDLWIVGGSEVFAQTIAQTDELYLTHIDGVFGCDRFFPEYQDNFELVSQSEPITENGLKYTFCIYTRK